MQTSITTGGQTSGRVRDTSVAKTNKLAQALSDIGVQVSYHDAFRLLTTIEDENVTTNLLIVVDGYFDAEGVQPITNRGAAPKNQKQTNVDNLVKLFTVLKDYIGKNQMLADKIHAHVFFTQEGKWIEYPNVKIKDSWERLLKINGVEPDENAMDFTVFLAPDLLENFGHDLVFRKRKLEARN